MKLGKLNMSLNLFRFCQIKKPHRKTSSNLHSARSIIINHERNPNFVFR